MQVIAIERHGFTGIALTSCEVSSHSLFRHYSLKFFVFHKLFYVSFGFSKKGVTFVSLNPGSP